MQSKVDSAMEIITNTVIGYFLGLIVWVIVAALYDIHVTAGQNVGITIVFTAVSIGRQYTLRRIFNGRTVWQTIKTRFS